MAGTVFYQSMQFVYQLYTSIFNCYNNNIAHSAPIEIAQKTLQQVQQND
jgi:hypothetical protein